MTGRRSAGRRSARTGPTLFDAAPPAPGAEVRPPASSGTTGTGATSGRLAARDAGRITARALALGLEPDLDIDRAARELLTVAGGDPSSLWLALRRVERSDAGHSGATERAALALRRALEFADHRLAS